MENYEFLRNIKDNELYVGFTSLSGKKYFKDNHYKILNDSDLIRFTNIESPYGNISIYSGEAKSRFKIFKSSKALFKWLIT